MEPDVTITVDEWPGTSGGWFIHLDGVGWDAGHEHFDDEVAATTRANRLAAQLRSDGNVVWVEAAS